MGSTRIIARMDIKSSHLVKGIQFEGLRKIGIPNEYALKYYIQGADEIFYLDIVASLYNRKSLKEIITKTTENVFVPITAGGGIRSIDDVKDILRAGADKVAINTAAIKRPELIREVSEKFGSQCMVLSIEAKKVHNKQWLVYYDNGREKTEFDAIEWAIKGYELGAGEIIITSVDSEGTQAGFDLELIQLISKSVPIPVIASGGAGSPKDVRDAIVVGNADAVAVASILHYNKYSIGEIKEELHKHSVSVRR